MGEETARLTELMLDADLFCAQIEKAAKKALPLSEMQTLSLKIGQCRSALAQLQELYEDDELTIGHPATRASFRSLVMSLLWVNFLAKGIVDFKLFRKLVQIESGFTYLLITHTR